MVAVMPVWTTRARELAEEAEPGWKGIWMLTVAARRALFNSSLAVPSAARENILSAVSQLRAAQAEVEWAHPGLPMRYRAVDFWFGRLRPDENEALARLIVDPLVTAALQRATDLQAANLTASEMASLQRAICSLTVVRGKVTGLISEAAR